MHAIKLLSILVLASLALVGVGKHDAQPPKLEFKTGATIECRFLNGWLKLDGLLDDAAWEKAQIVSLAVPWEKRKSSSPTTARLLWDREALYFCAEMEDHDLFADLPLPNSSIWDNDSFAMVIKPNTKKRPLAYYQFQISAASAPLQVFYASRGAGGFDRFANFQLPPFEWTTKLRGTLNDWTDSDKSWSVEGRIPWQTFTPIGGRPNPGDKWRICLFRYDYSVTLERPELSASRPLKPSGFAPVRGISRVSFCG